MATRLDPRLAGVLRVALRGWLAVVLLGIAPDFYRILPSKVRWYWPEALALGMISAYGLARWRARDRSPEDPVGARVGRWVDRVDGVDEAVLWRILAAVLGSICGWCLATWIPHYLTWPWSRDEDTFAVLAMSWDRGILPYRDIRAYNFPGETYLFWAVGKVFGWGRTAPFYAIDAGAVVALGAVLVGWSRRRLGGAAAGLVGYLVFLTFYLSQPFETTGERDWHTAFLVGTGLMALQAWPGRASRIASAMAMAMALSIRPHALLFLPALLAAAVADGEGAGPGRARRGLEWSLWLSAFVGVLAIPLVADGIVDDLIRGLRVASYGGPYSKATPAGAATVFLRQFADWRTDVPMAATVLLAIASRGAMGRLARAWAWAWAGALLYRPVHPIPHAYLVHPIVLVGAITYALPVAWLISRRWPAKPVRLVAVALFVYEILPGRPFYCSARESGEAFMALVRGEDVRDAPLGGFGPFYWRRGEQYWARHCELLEYLRHSTGPGTMVANVLNRFPYESLNGPTGRLSPFRAESGICWLSWVDIDLDPEFARDLERATDSVVVWEPSQSEVDPRMRLERVIEVVRRCYEPEARFGTVEVWRRRCAGDPRSRGAESQAETDPPRPWGGRDRSG